MHQRVRDRESTCLVCCVLCVRVEQVPRGSHAEQATLLILVLSRESLIKFLYVRKSRWRGRTGMKAETVGVWLDHSDALEAS